MKSLVDDFLKCLAVEGDALQTLELVAVGWPRPVDATSHSLLSVYSAPVSESTTTHATHSLKKELRHANERAVSDRRIDHDRLCCNRRERTGAKQFTVAYLRVVVVSRVICAFAYAVAWCCVDDQEALVVSQFIEE